MIISLMIVLGNSLVDIRLIVIWMFNWLEHKNLKKKKRQISTSVLLLLLWMETIISFWVGGSLYRRHHVLSCDHAPVLHLQRGLVSLVTPTVRRSCTVFRSQNTAGGCWWMAEHAADTPHGCSRRHWIPLDGCAFQNAAQPWGNAHATFACTLQHAA